MTDANNEIPGRLRIKGFGPWRTLKGELWITVDRDFERKILPLLRLFWPDLVQAPPLGKWDQKGIDLISWGEGAPLACAIQCKGIQKQELEQDHVRQTLHSIEAFAKSDAQCERYIVVHNREGGQRAYASQVEAALANLVASGRVPVAELWDLDMLLTKAATRIVRRVTDALHRASAEQQRRLSSLFRFGHLYVSAVPVVEERLQFRRDRPCLREPAGEPRLLEVAQGLAESTDARWTLLTGTFGAGKTTTSLHTVLQSGRIVIYGACRVLNVEQLRSSTNALLSQLISVTDAFDDFEDADRVRLEKLAGPTLGKLLRQENTPYSILLDALDETVAYSTVAGLQRLSNQLAEFRCPIVLTTRKEHLDALFGDFSIAFTELGQKNAPTRHARHLTLLPWDASGAFDLVERCRCESEGTERIHLDQLADVIATGEYERLYGGLIGNPLFLQFILEDVALDGLRERSRAALIRDWAERKIRRDIARRPSGLVAEADAEETVAQMIATMEDVAAAMVSPEAPFDLIEYIEATHIEGIAKRHFKLAHVPIVEVLLNSLLVPRSERKGASLEIVFVFRVLQEFFVASYLRREGASSVGYPTAVSEFWNELDADRPKG